MKLFLVCVTALARVSFSFHIQPMGIANAKGQLRSTSSSRFVSQISDASATTEDRPAENEIMSVTAPLKFIGPYPCLSLRFPDLQTSSQRDRNISGISLDFVLDTAANTNVIQGPVAQELKLARDTEHPALPGLSASGSLAGGETYVLGNAQLEGVPSINPNATQDIFMTNLTASVLPIANPAAAGILSLAFLQCFQGGVEFDWEAQQLTFYAVDRDMDATEWSKSIPIQRQAVTQLPLIQVDLNGRTLTALLDTGSPVTIINSIAAEAAQITSSETKKTNPVAALFSKGPPPLTIMGADGKPTQLLPSAEPVQVGDFGSSPLYVGQVPGLAAMGSDSPDLILGMDVLRLQPKMLLRAQTNELLIK